MSGSPRLRGTVRLPCPHEVSCEDCLVYGNVTKPLTSFLLPLSFYLSLFAFPFLILTPSFLPSSVSCLPSHFSCVLPCSSLHFTPLWPHSIPWLQLSFPLPLFQTLESTKYLFHLKTVPYTVLSTLQSKHTKNKLASVLESSLSFCELRHLLFLWTSEDQSLCFPISSSSLPLLSQFLFPSLSFAALCLEMLLELYKRNLPNVLQSWFSANIIVLDINAFNASKKLFN